MLSLKQKAQELLKSADIKINPSKKEHIPYIGLEHIQPNCLRVTEIGDSADTQSGKKKFEAGDVLFGSLRVYFRKVIRPKINGVCSTDITVLKAKEDKLDQKYLFYLVCNPQFIDRASGQGEGTRMPRTGWNIISKFDISIPEDIKEQKRIAGVLSGFDDKIELNNKINQNLEQTAQEIFKEWFVKNKKSKSWEIKKITKIIKRLPVGKKYDNKTALPKGKIPVLDQGQSGFIGYHNDQPGVKASIENPVVIFTNHTCNYRLMTRDFSCIQNVLPYVGDKGYSTLFVYFLTKGKIKMQEYKGHWPEFEEQVFLLPPSPLAQKFTNYIKPIIEKMVGIENENQKLASLRDLLLPKLMSGEIKV